MAAGGMGSICPSSQVPLCIRWQRTRQRGDAYIESCNRASVRRRIEVFAVREHVTNGRRRTLATDSAHRVLSCFG
eukprot:2750153-Prymnesium_polylepis.1